MSAGSSNLRVLGEVSSEMEAAPIIEALGDRGIRAMAVGGYTAAFAAEVPGTVRILVGQADLPLARQILDRLRADPADIDWASIDVGDESEADDGSDSPPTDPNRGRKEEKEDQPVPRRPFQFSIASLLALQTIVAAICSLWKGIAAVLVAVIVVAVLLAFVIVPTVWVSSDISRAREVWRQFGRAVTVGMAVWLSFLVIRIVRELVAALLP